MQTLYDDIPGRQDFLFRSSPASDILPAWSELDAEWGPAVTIATVTRLDRIKIQPFGNMSVKEGSAMSLAIHFADDRCLHYDSSRRAVLRPAHGPQSNRHRCHERHLRNPSPCRAGLPQKCWQTPKASRLCRTRFTGLRGWHTVGRGVLLVRGPGGAWQAPRMIEITGGSLGYQIGVQSTDLILIFRTPQSVTNVMRGTLKVGVDASVGGGASRAAGIGSNRFAAEAEILSYSRARGAFSGGRR